MSWDRQLVMAGIILEPLVPGSHYSFYYFARHFIQNLSFDAIGPYFIIHFYPRFYKYLKQKLSAPLIDSFEQSQQRKKGSDNEKKGPSWFGSQYMYLTYIMC